MGIALSKSFKDNNCKEIQLPSLSLAWKDLNILAVSQPTPLEFEELLQSLIVGIPTPVKLWTMLGELVSEQYLGSKGACLFNLAKAISAVLLSH